MKMLSYITSLFLGVFIFLLIPTQVHAQVTSGPTNPYSFWAKSGPAAGQVTIYWTDDGTASQYDVVYGTTVGQYTWGALNIGAVQDAVNAYTVSALTPGTTYYFSLVAKNGDTFVARTGPVWAKAAGGQVAAAPAPVQAVQAAVPVAPVSSTTSGPVGDFSFRAASGVSAGTVDLMWIDNGTASQYALAYGTTSGQYTFGVQSIQEAPNQVMKFTVGALTPGTTYYFVLYAKQGDQYVSTSPQAWAKATGGTVAVTSSTPIVQTAVAAAPVISTAGPVSDYVFSAKTGMTSGTVDLMWIDRDTASKYAILYGTEPGKYTFGVQPIAEIPNQSMSFTIGALQSGKRYYFALIAENSGKTAYTTSAVSAVAR